MKVRIIRQKAWDTDGTQLSRFNVGDTYDIPDSLAIYAIMDGWASAVEPLELDPTVVDANRALREELRASRTGRKKLE
jgi:hypothetical protein